MCFIDAYFVSIFVRCFVFCIANSLLFHLSLKCVSRNTRWDSAHQILAASIVFYAVIVFVFFAANIFGGVTRVAVWGYFGTLLCVGWCVLLATNVKKNNLKRKLNQSSLTLCLLIIAWFVSIAFVNALTNYPVDTDSLIYHIPLPVNWIQSESLYAPQCMHWSCPGNNEIIGCWLLIFFEGDFLVGLNNLPSMVVLVLGLFLSVRQLGFSPASAFGLTVMAISNGVMFRQVCDQENDLAVAGFFVSCVFFGTRFFLSGDGADLVIAGVAFGLLGGVKYYALGYSFVLFFCFLICSLVRTWRFGLVIGIVFGSSFVALALFWYLRNYFCGGMLLYPFSFARDVDLSRRAYPSLETSSIRGNGDLRIPILYLSATLEFLGAGYFLAVMLFPVIICIGLLKICYLRRAPIAALIRLMLQVATLAVFLITPFAVEDEPGTLNQMKSGYCPVRYSLPFLLLSFLNGLHVLRGSLFAAYGAAKSGLRSKPGVIGFDRKFWLRFIRIGIFCVLPIVAGVIQGARWCCVTGIDVVVVVGVCVVLWIAIVLMSIFDRSGSWWWRITSCLFGMIGLCGVCFLFSVRGYYWEENFNRFYQGSFGVGIVRFVGQNKDCGMKVAVFTYPIYGFYGGSRNVVLMQPYYLADDVGFVNYLKANEIKLCIGSPNGMYVEGSPFLVANRVIKKFPLLFSPLTLDRRSLILYKVNENYFDQALVLRKFLGVIFPFLDLWYFLDKDQAG